MDIEKQKAEDVAKWLLGLVFSAAIATFQNWRSKREQAKVFRAQIQEIHEVVKPTAAPGEEESSHNTSPGPSEPPSVTDDLRTIVQRIQQQLTEHQSRGDERHEANIARFESIEVTQKRVGEDISDLRQYMRHNRGENRAMMKKILTKLSGLATAPSQPDEDEPCR